MHSVIKQWVFTLPLRMQSVLMAAIRGADGHSKEDKSKHLVRALRGLLLNNADPTNSFIKDDLTEEQVESFASDIDHYYVHFLMHFTHAAEIVGYKHPDNFVRGRWLSIYRRICKSLHLNYETEPQLDIRLGHTPEWLEAQKKQVETPLLPIPAPMVDPEARRKAQAERPIEIDDPIPKHIDDKTAKLRGRCTCGHEYEAHYQLKPETQPTLYECSGGKCEKRCVSYVEYIPPQPVASTKKQMKGTKPSTLERLVEAVEVAGAVLCICGHSRTSHQVPNFSGREERCSSCSCLRFVERTEANRTGDAGTGTSRNEGYGRGSS